ERGENNPQRVLLQRIMAAAFEWHNYGKSTIGNRADIERVPIDNLQEFYRRFYRPDNALLIVAGKFDGTKALELVAKYFGVLKKPDLRMNLTYTEEPAQDGERSVRMRRVGSVPLVGVAYHIPAGGHAEYPAAEVLEGILTADVSGRLYKSLVETKKAASVSGLTFSLHDPGAVIMIAQAAAGQDPADLLSALLSTIDEVAKNGVTAEEVERVRTMILKQRELAAADSARLAISLSNWASQGDWRLYFLFRDRLEQVTAEQVSAVAAKYLKADNRTVGIFEPTQTPDRATVPQLVDLDKTVEDYKGREDVATGEQFDVSPSNIEQRTRRLNLRSGVKAALIEKKTRANAVTLRLSLKYGTVDSLKGRQAAAEVLPDLMLRGTKALSRQQIDDEFDKLRAQVSASSQPGEAVFTVRARRQTLPAVLTLLRQILREPSLPEKELELLKQSALAGMENGLTDPQTLAQTMVRRHVTPYEQDDPRYVPTVPEEIEMLKAVDRAAVAGLYEKFLSGQYGELTIVGDFDSSEIVPAVESLLDGWKTSEKYVRIPRPAVANVTGGLEKILTPDKQNAVYFGAESFPVRDSDPEYPALALGNFILGGGALASRLGDRIRQKEGLSYTIQSALQTSALDPQTMFMVFAISNPANMPKVQAAVVEEIEKLLKDGVSPEELERARQGWLQQQQVVRSNDGTLAGTLATNLVADRTMAHQAKIEERISRLTREEVVEALRKRIDLKKFFIATAGDFDKQGDTTKPAPADKKPAGAAK
ncbi:MAG: insulinase family protein, partial [Planctomycetaceae bacterium]